MKGLESSKLAENIINRKISIFYIETVLNFFSTPKKSESDRKKSKTSGNFSKHKKFKKKMSTKNHKNVMILSFCNGFKHNSQLDEIDLKNCLVTLKKQQYVLEITNKNDI